MWKDSYRIGVDIIDEQHKGLFDMVENLLNIVKQQQENVKDECIKAVAFLKDYVVKHFADEEAYQRSINYEGYEKHRMIHQGFIATVLDFEKKMAESGYDLAVVKQFTGMLVTWLIYHVASEDRRYIDLVQPAQPLAEAKTYQDSFTESMRKVFTTLTGAAVDDVVAGLPMVEEELYVSVGLTGRWEGDVVFIFPKETAFAIIQAMTFMEVEAVDDIVISALCEVSNIVSGNAASVLAAGGIKCDITTPNFSDEKQSLEASHSLRFATELGDVGVTLQLN